MKKNTYIVDTVKAFEKFNTFHGKKLCSKLAMK